MTSGSGSVSRPVSLEQRVKNAQSTGLAGLDALLGGGVPPGTVHVCIGEPMNSLELLGLHFVAGASVEGQGAYFTTETTEAEVKRGVDAVGGRSGRVHVVRLPFKGKWTPPAARKGMRYVVDSMSTVILQAGFQESFAALRRLKEQMRENGDTLLVLLTAGLHKDQEVVMLKQWADGVMELGYDRQGFGLYPYMKITKMRGVPDVNRLLLIKETDRGLSLDSTKRVF